MGRTVQIIEILVLLTLKMISLNQRDTSFVGTESGLERSIQPEFRCWLEQDGTKGPETGVKPVPPSINESKLNGIPAVGVVIGTPATSDVGADANIFLEGVKEATGNEVGRGRTSCFGHGGKILIVSGSCFI